MPKFSNAEKAQELKRELGMRRHVYPRRVTEGKMQQAAADRLISLTEDMLADYEKLAAADTPDLFAPDSSAAYGPAGIHAPPDRVPPPPMRSSDPTFGKTPGIEIEREGQRFGTCKCGESTLTGQVRDVQTRTLNWRVFDAMPTEHNGFRYYTRHQCEHTRRRG